MRESGCGISSKTLQAVLRVDSLGLVRAWCVLHAWCELRDAQNRSALERCPSCCCDVQG